MKAYLKPHLKSFSILFLGSLNTKSGPSNDYSVGNKKSQKISEDIQDFEKKLRFTRPCHDKGGVITKVIFKLAIISSRKRAKSLFLYFSTKSWEIKERWFGSFLWGWDSIQNTFWDYPTFEALVGRSYFISTLRVSWNLIEAEIMHNPGNSSKFSFSIQYLIRYDMIV